MCLLCLQKKIDEKVRAWKQMDKFKKARCLEWENSSHNKDCDVKQEIMKILIFETV